jgi:peptidoglycan/LPS O-acetylase OafA/YrhL
MGLFRLLLALSVALGHLHHNQKVMIDGFVAVQCFFMLSGFFIFKTYTHKYATYQHPIFKFYINRFLRIMPLYWLSFIGLMIWAVIQHHYYPNTPNRVAPFIYFFPKLNVFENVHFLFSNFALIGLDWFHFIGFTAQHHYQFSSQIIGAQELIILKPAWSLSIELMFYLLTPFIIKLTNRQLLFCITILLLLRFNAYQQGFESLNWIYMFFPFEVAIFLIGGLAFRLSEKKLIVTQKILSIVFCSIPASVIVISFFSINPYTCWAYYSFIFVGLICCNEAPIWLKKIDTHGGSLSYPIYIFHFILVNLLNTILDNENYLLFIVLLSLASVVLYFIQQKLDVIRTKIIQLF